MPRFEVELAASHGINLEVSQRERHERANRIDPILALFACGLPDEPVEFGCRWLKSPKSTRSFKVLHARHGLATTQGHCVYANPALERLTGLNSDQINRADWRSFLLEEDRAVASASWQRSLATGTPYCLQVLVRRSDGVPECVELIAFGHKSRQRRGTMIVHRVRRQWWGAAPR